MDDTYTVPNCRDCSKNNVPQTQRLTTRQVLVTKQPYADAVLTSLRGCKLLVGGALAVLTQALVLRTGGCRYQSNPLRAGALQKASLIPAKLQFAVAGASRYPRLHNRSSPGSRVAQPKATGPWHTRRRWGLAAAGTGARAAARRRRRLQRPHQPLKQRQAVRWKSMSGSEGRRGSLTCRHLKNCPARLPARKAEKERWH